MVPIQIDIRLIGSQTQASATIQGANGVPDSYSEIERTGALALSTLTERLSKRGYGGRKFITSDGLRGEIPARR